jgi:hypothetical protein
LIPTYFSLKVLDDTFLHIRGLPFFGQVWDYLAAFCKLQKNFEKLEEFTQRTIRECRDYNFDFLQAEFDFVVSGKMITLKNKLQNRISENEKYNYPAGYSILRLHILRLQEINNLDEAESILDQAKITKDDFSWLEDMRLLAKCELEKRRTNIEKEKELQKKFLEKQPLLFEPDHALNFNLLDYQENLKIFYQQNRLRNHA